MVCMHTIKLGFGQNAPMYAEAIFPIIYVKGRNWWVM